MPNRYITTIKCDRQIIKATLTNLPRTLDEIYDRLFRAIPEDERLFVWHALHWISFDGALYERSEMPCSILPQVAEASAARAGRQLDHIFYDFQTLRDLCGCLIYVNIQTQQVTFAHYTVQEYLRRTRIYQGVSETLAHPFFLDFICTETPRIHQEDLGNAEEGHFQHGNFVIANQMNGNLNIYYATASMLSLNQEENWIEQRNVSLVVDSLDPSKGHFDATRRVLDIAYRDLTSPTISGLYHVKRLWQGGWGPNLDTYHMEALHLLN
jgi:hypothetical protein